MPETRRPSTRLKSERQSKRKATTPPPATTPKPKKRTPTPEPVEEVEVLPSKVSEGDQLPIIKEPQPQNLSDHEFQTIAESGVLKASLDKSRQTWLAATLFEKYWSKVTKKNPQGASNPDKSSMQRLGPCTLIIEPHHFDIITHSVKSSQQVTFLPPQNPLYSQFGGVPHGLPYGNIFPPPAPPQPTQQAMIPPGQSGGPTLSTAPNQAMNGPPPAMTPSSSSTPIPVATVPAPSDTPSPAAKSSPVPTGGTQTVNQQPTSKAIVSGTPGIQPRQNAPSISSNPNGVSPQPALQSTPQPPQPPQHSSHPSAPKPLAPASDNSGTDPVIQMLAARAAEDPSLKALMKVVAQGNANQEQLAIFQRHIDELNAIINERKRQASNLTGNAPQKASPAPSASSPTPRASVPAPVMNPSPVVNPPPVMNPASTAPRPIHPASAPPMKNEVHPTYYPPPYPQPQQIKAKPTQVKKEVSAIVFEFVGSPHTRYLLPKNSIVEKVSDSTPTEYLMSFLVTKKATAEMRGTYKEDKEYYQSVTIKLHSNNEKFLEGLPRAVAPPDEVIKYMTNVMETLDLAEDVHLATRLPREAGEEYKPKESKPREVLQDLDIPQDRYLAPDSILPLRPTVH